MIAASYEARKKGVYTTQSILEAKKRCPEAIFVRRDHQLYQQYSEKIMDFLRLIGDTEVASIDEAYVDITERVKGGVLPKKIARYIQDTLWEKLHMPCSIGIGPTKIIAKMAAGIKKPRGWVRLGIKQFQSYFHPQQVSVLHGCGKKTAEKLNRNGIYTIGQLAAADPYRLKLLFGKRGEWLQQAARGTSSNTVNTFREKGAKTIGKETTFGTLMSDQEFILNVADRMVERLVQRLQNKGKKARTVSIVYKKDRGKNHHSKSSTLLIPTDKQEEIMDEVYKLYQIHLWEVPIYLFGVRLSNLETVHYEQLSIDDIR